MQEGHPVGLNHEPAFRRVRAVIAELCDAPPGPVDQRLRTLALRVPNQLVHRPEAAPGRSSTPELRGAAMQLVREIERAGESGELAPARYQRLKQLSTELLDVC